MGYLVRKSWSSALPCLAWRVASIAVLVVQPAAAQPVVSACGTISGATVWDSGSVYVLDHCGVTIEAGASLAIQPGTVVKLQGSHDQIIVDGELVIAGTAADPVVLSSLSDDGPAGDTNGDGNATAPEPGDWGWVLFRPGSSGRIDYATIAYGGVGAHGYTHWAMMKVEGPSDVAVANSTLRDSWSDVFYTEGASSSVTGSRIVSNGFGSGFYGLHYSGLDPGIVLDISDNEFETVTAGSRALRLVLDNHPARIRMRRNTAVGSGLNGVVLSGTVQSDLDLDVVESVPFVIEASVTVADEATLTLSPGTIFKPTGCGNKLSVDGTLLAMATEERPVVFTSLRDDRYGGDTNGDGDASAPAAGNWGYIRFNAGAGGQLDHVFVAYGGVACTGYDNYAMFQTIEADVVVEHATFAAGYFNTVYSVDSQLRIHRSSLAGSSPSNASAVRNAGGKLEVDARYNWWGDPSGPHHPSKNPSGLGGNVSNGVRFLPWAIDENGRLVTQVLLEGPARVSPGETGDFALSYFAGDSIEDAVLKLELPPDAEYVDSDGTLWDHNREVFWTLGDLPESAEGEKWLRLRFPFGAPDAKEVARAMLDGTNFDGGGYEFDTAPYSSYEPPEAGDLTALTEAELSPLIAARADVKGLVDRAVAEGLMLIGGGRRRLEGGQESWQAFLLGTGELRTVSWDDEGALSVQLRPEGVVFADAGGSMRIEDGTGAVNYEGEWAPAAAAATFGNQTAEPPIGKGACFNNCIMLDFKWRQSPGFFQDPNAVRPKSYGQRLLRRRLFRTLNSKECRTLCARFNRCDSCLSSLLYQERHLPGLENILTRCNRACDDETTRPRYNCDNAVDPDRPPPAMIICTGSSGATVWPFPSTARMAVFRCDRASGAWREEEDIECLCRGGSGSKGVVHCRQDNYYAICVEENGSAGKCAKGSFPFNEENDLQCRPENLAGYWGETPVLWADPTPKIMPEEDASACSAVGTEVRRARDPNEKAGVRGEVVPGELLTYTVSFENVGAGRAFDVYVVDDLSPHLDESTLDLGGSGEFYPITRSILWDIGELAPNGEEGSEGERVFTIRVRPDLPNGTVIKNQAIVYFPSVPEETATNTVVNVVETLVAHPQSLETDYGSPIEITLTGADVSGAQLTFAIAQLPSNGALSGTVPSLTYTPAENFTGHDHFTFTVGNGADESREAEVAILVHPTTGDSIAPEVLWTYPPDGALWEEVSDVPVASGEETAVYAPSVAVGFSETMASSTVDTTSMVVTHLGGAPVDAVVSWDGLANRAVLAPLEPWLDGGYTATVTTAMRDAAGNALPESYSWSFRVGAAQTGCVGDCDGDGSVSINELIRGVNIALGAATLDVCPTFDSNGDAEVGINELIRAVNNALAGCEEPPATATPTRTGTVNTTPSRTPTQTRTHTATRTRTGTASPSATTTVTKTPTATATRTRTDSPTRTVTVTATRTATPSSTATVTRTRSPEPTETATPDTNATPTPPFFRRLLSLWDSGV